jgi:hypothetical protein
MRFDYKGETDLERKKADLDILFEYLTYLSDRDPALITILTILKTQQELIDASK